MKIQPTYITVFFSPSAAYSEHSTSRRFIVFILQLLSPAYLQTYHKDERALRGNLQNRKSLNVGPLCCVVINNRLFMRLKFLLPFLSSSGIEGTNKWVVATTELYACPRLSHLNICQNVGVVSRQDSDSYRYAAWQKQVLA